VHSRTASPHELAAQWLGIPPRGLTWASPARVRLHVDSRDLNDPWREVRVVFAQLCFGNALPQQPGNMMNRQARCRGLAQTAPDSAPIRDFLRFSKSMIRNMFKAGAGRGQRAWGHLVAAEFTR
jgi:hypothetical protein